MPTHVTCVVCQRPLLERDPDAESFYWQRAAPICGRAGCQQHAAEFLRYLHEYWQGDREDVLAVLRQQAIAATEGQRREQD
jgi:hypothetical protein